MWVGLKKFDRSGLRLEVGLGEAVGGFSYGTALPGSRPSYNGFYHFGYRVLAKGYIYEVDRVWDNRVLQGYVPVLALPIVAYCAHVAGFDAPARPGQGGQVGLGFPMVCLDIVHDGIADLFLLRELGCRGGCGGSFGGGCGFGFGCGC